MKTPRAPQQGVHRVVSPWIRNVLTGEVRREDGAGRMVAQLPRGHVAASKQRVDHALRVGGYILIDLPGGCIIEKEPEATQ